MHAGVTEVSSALRGEGEVCGALTLCITAVAFQSQSDLTFVQMPKHLLPEAHKKSNKTEEEGTEAEHKGDYVSSRVPRPTVQGAGSEIPLSRLSSSGAGAATSRPATANSGRANAAENRTKNAEEWRRERHDQVLESCAAKQRLQATMQIANVASECAGRRHMSRFQRWLLAWQQAALYVSLQ